MKKIIKIAALSLLILLAASTAGLFIWSKIGTYPAGDTANAALIADENTSVSTSPLIEFIPDSSKSTGIVFYPGGLVEPEAYAPVLRQVADAGYYVAITPMPFNLAIINTRAAKQVIKQNPEIETWIIAGHSLGGAAAAIFAGNNSDDVDAIVFWDSYPPDSASLTDSGLAVLSIFGTTGGIPNTENFNDKRGLLPADTEFVAIEGANHAQFGDYGLQKGDVSASISMQEQHNRVAEIMLQWLSQFPTE